MQCTHGHNYLLLKDLTAEVIEGRFQVNQDPCNHDVHTVRRKLHFVCFGAVLLKLPRKRAFFLNFQFILDQYL